jgi:hypothetical protein
MEGNMSHRIRYFLPFALVLLARPATAGNLDYVKCASNQDRVWVYESLNSFDVEAKLRCGEPVEILLRVKGFVKIRMASGVEGYVPDATFPDLPALPDEDQRSVASAAAVAARRNLAAHASMNASSPVTPATQPVAAVEAKTSVISKSVASVEVKVAPIAATAATVTQTKEIAAVLQPQPTRATPQIIVSANVAPKVSTKTVARTVAEAPAISEVPPSPTVSLAIKEDAAMIPTPRDLARPKPVADSPEGEDYPDTKPENESADPLCRQYFSVYGLAPSQYKWLEEERRKQFSGICPAPDLAHVDYVILLGHDSNTYTDAMPVAVHTDAHGFSDFSPMTAVDTALLSGSDLQKTRCEFVWVFHVKRGNFDPEKFSPRRRPQYSDWAKGSRASAHSLEDAFNFIQTQPQGTR